MGLAGVVIVVLAALIALVAPMPAVALVPGTNGLIAFVSSRDHLDSGSDIYVMNADGSNPVNLTNNPAYDAEPNWGVLAAPQTATTTALDVTPASPAAANTVQTLKATVTPSGSAGSVQFKDGTTTIGNPVTVTNGTAMLTTALPPGTHALTAVFTPNDPTKSGSSTATTRRSASTCRPCSATSVSPPAPSPHRQHLVDRCFVSAQPMDHLLAM